MYSTTQAEFKSTAIPVRLSTCSMHCCIATAETEELATHCQSFIQLGRGGGGLSWDSKLSRVKQKVYKACLL